MVARIEKFSLDWALCFSVDLWGSHTLFLPSSPAIMFFLPWWNIYPKTGSQIQPAPLSTWFLYSSTHTMKAPNTLCLPAKEKGFSLEAWKNIMSVNSCQQSYLQCFKSSWSQLITGPLHRKWGRRMFLRPFYSVLLHSVFTYTHFISSASHF